jgi:ubiquinol-cytochrome c reductase cytochrome b subunit
LIQTAQERMGLAPLRREVLDRRVPKTPWYFGDGSALMMLLGVLIVTGMLMALNYSASPDTAYESVVDFTDHQRLGWFIRGLHYWAAGFMVVIIVAHMCRQILLGGYKPPREATWLFGVMLLFAVLAMSFTGYILRWDARAIYGVKVFFHMLHNVPAIGDMLVLMAQGGDEIGARTLSRFYAVHVVILPILILALVGWHLYLVILHGVTTRGERGRFIRTAEEQRKLYKEQADSEAQGETFHPYSTAKLSGVVLVVFIALLLTAILAGPPELLGRADLTRRVFPAEEWWFWWYSGLIALLPPAIAPAVMVLLPLLAFILLVSLPFIDRGPRRGLRRRPLAAALVLLVVVTLLALSDYRRRSPWTAWPAAELPPVPEGITLSPEADLGRQLFARFGCSTCHPVAGEGWAFGPDLARIPDARPRAEMVSFILQPPEGVAMPAYAGRISEEELERLLDYVHAAQAWPRE